MTRPLFTGLVEFSGDSEILFITGGVALMDVGLVGFSLRRDKESVELAADQVPSSASAKFSTTNCFPMLISLKQKKNQ